MLRFKKEEVVALLSALKPNAEVMLVGDHGVYLMSFDQKPEERKIVYAVGCNPNTDEDFYDNKEAEFGGDDGGDVVGTVSNLKRIVDACKSELHIRLTSTQIKIQSDVKVPVAAPKSNINPDLIPPQLR